MTPRDVTYSTLTDTIQGGDVVAPVPFLTFTVDNAATVGVDAAGSITNDGIVASGPWSIAAVAGVTVSPSSGSSIAPGAVVALTFTLTEAGTTTHTLTCAGATITGNPQQIVTVATPLLAVLTGADTSIVGEAAAFAVTLDAQADQTYTVTPSATGSGVVSPSTRTITAGNTVGMFTVTGADAETVSVDFTISPSLTRVGRPISLVVSAGALPGLTLSAVSTTGSVGTPGAATITNNGASSCQWALSTSAGMTATPSSGTLAAGASVSPVLAYSTPGTKTLTLVNNSGGTITGTNPASITVTAAAATVATLALSTSGTTGSNTTGTVTLNGVAPSAGTVTIAGTGATITPSTLSWTLGESGTAKSFTINRATNGTTSVSITNSMGLTNAGTPVSYTSTGLAPAPTGNIVQYLTGDGGAASSGSNGNFSGPSRDFWHRRLGISWDRTNLMGNWLDSSQVTEGSTPYGSSAALTTVGQVASVTVTTLVARWRSNGLNRGFYLATRTSTSAWPVAFHGRLDATAGNRPKLTVVTSAGTTELTAAANACWGISSFAGQPSGAEWSLSAGAQPAILRFDLSTITGTLVSATLTWKVKSFGGTTGQIVDVFEADPPVMVVPEGVTSPVLGMAAEFDDYTAMKTSGDSRLLFCDDFETPGPFDSGFSPALTRTLNPDSGTIYGRGTIATGANGSADRNISISTGTGTQGAPNVVYEQLFGQYWLYLEDTFGTTQPDAIKIPAMGVQFGYWNPVGYWQQTTGNGGSPGTGLKVDRGGGLNYEYQGHSVRFLTGTEPTDPDDDPYRGYFSMSEYAYHLDQVGPNPAGSRFGGNVVIRKGQWYCIDIEVLQNTMSGGTDGLGNRDTANLDGKIRAWINGYPALDITRRWRKHAEMGVQGLWVDVYHGGVTTAPRDMHYRLDRVSVATEYIGPPAVVLPTWVPDAGAATTLTNSNGRLSNNYRSVVNDYYDAFYAVKSVGGFNGGYVNQYWGDFGALLFWGGGHSDTNHNAMIALELTATGGTYKRLADASDYYGASALSGSARTTAIGLNGIGYVVVAGKASGKNTSTGVVSGNEYCESLVGDGAPNSPHSWGSGDVIGPADGGAPYGTFLQVLNQANTREENYSVYAAHRLSFSDLSHGLGARSWARASNNWDQTIPIGSAPLHSVHVPAHGRVYTFGRAAIRQIRWYDIAAGTYHTGTGEGFTLDQASAPGGNGGGAVFHVPERNLIVCCYGWPNLVVQWISVAPGVTQPTRLSGGGGTATLSAAVSVETFFGSACWCPDNSRIIVGGLAAADTIAEIAIPATLTDPWTVETTTTTAGVLPSPLTGTNNPQIFKRWRYNPRVKAIVLQRFATLSGDDTVYVYRPRNT